MSDFSEIKHIIHALIKKMYWNEITEVQIQFVIEKQQQ